MASIAREYHCFRLLHAYSWAYRNRSAVLAGGTFPGPLIRGRKVSHDMRPAACDEHTYHGTQGDRFKLNVINSLTDNTMLRSTTIVRVDSRRTRPMFIHYPPLITPPHSTGTGSTRRGRTPQTGRLSSPNAPLLPTTLSSTNSPSQSRREHIGTIHTCVSSLTTRVSDRALLTKSLGLATQYCDGLRGALVVYDPNDPYKLFYDVDDGRLLPLYFPALFCSHSR